ncbi:MAG: hypothetical protein ABIQ88_18785 [Chitinophagaceae bacterium]
MKQISLLTIACLLLLTTANAQGYGGIEQYYYASGSGSAGLVPKIFYQTSKNWYAEARYNYEEAKTFSMVAGKAFSGENMPGCSVTPMAGFATGQFNGLLLALKTELNFKKLFFFSESQYNYAVRNRYSSFIYSWVDAGYKINDQLSAGTAMQVNISAETGKQLEPGVFIEFSYKKWTFPVYIFNTAAKDRYAVVGVSYELIPFKNSGQQKK